LIGVNDTIPFSAPVNLFPPGNNITGRPVAIGDFNGDGYDDIAIGSSLGDEFEVYLSDGHGGFSGPLSVPEISPDRTPPNSIAAADVTGDGKIDLIEPDTSDGSIYVFPGLGNGQFGTPLKYFAFDDPLTVAVGDVNNDGYPDVLVASSGRVSVLLGGPTGLHGASASYGVGLNITSIALGDVNGDGNLDVIANDSRSQVTLLTGDGHGGFSAPIAIPLPAPASDVKLADIDGDRRLDIIAATANGVCALHSIGNGTFLPPVLSPDSQATSLAVADFNGDGLADLLTKNSSGLSLQINVGGDQFAPAQQIISQTLPQGFALGDFNGDGIPDAVMTSNTDIAPTSIVFGEPSSFQGQSYDVLAPVRVLSINRLSPMTSPTADTSVTYEVDFSQPVIGVDADDFRAVTNGVHVGGISVSASSGSAIDVTLTGITGSGTVQLNLLDNQTITSLTGAPLGGGVPFGGSFTGQIYTIDQSRPTVLGINREQPISPTVVGGSVEYQVLFSEPVFGVDSSDFQVLTTGDATYTAPLVVEGGGYTYAVTVNGISGGGTLTLTLVDNGTIHDALGTTLASPTGGFSLDAAAATQITAPRGVDGQPFVELAGDLNGDGIVDRVTLDPHDIDSELGVGDGTFQPVIRTPIPIEIDSATLGDVNEDGKLDLIGISFTSLSIFTFLGNGDGTFASTPVISHLAQYESQITVADVNSDQKADLVLSGQTAVRVMIGNGLGGFTAGATFPMNEAYVGVADFNGDHHLDIATGAGIEYGDGAGNFTLGNQSFAATNVLAADFNHDGNQDVLAFSANGNYQVWLGDGSGSFSPQPMQTFPGNTNIAVGDLNSDGYPDLVFTEPLKGTLDVAMGVGDGTFGPLSYYNAGVEPSNFALADFNDDQQLDVAVGTLYGSSLLLNKGAGNFESPTTVATTAGQRPMNIATGDFNGDGKADIVVGTASAASQNNGAIVVYFSNGDGTYTQMPQTPTGSAFAPSVTVADLNGDGIPDVIASWSYPTPATKIYLGTANGTLVPVPGQFSSQAVRDITTGDFNGDGKTDVFFNGQFFAGNGDGTFLPGVTITSDTTDVYADAADINQDGNLDLVLGGSTVSVLLGNGDGSFQPPKPLPFVGGGTFNPVVADMNRDGLPDLVVGNSADPTHVYVLLGNGDGSFGPTQTYSYGGSTNLTIGDFNGDGIPDVAVSTASVTLLLAGEGNGALAPPVDIAPAGLVTVADANDDGHADLLYAGLGLGNGSTYFPVVDAVLATTAHDAIGDTYRVIRSLDTITGTAGDDQILLIQDPDHVHIDWVINNNYGQMAIDDPAGLTIISNGGNDVITLNFAYGNPLPDSLHLVGSFTLDNAQAADAFTGHSIDIGSGPVFVAYTSPADDPIDAIRSYLQAGFDAGQWNGSPSAATGVLMSSFAATAPAQPLGIGYVDSASALIPGQPANTIELLTVPYGSTALNDTVGFTDLMRATQHYGATNATWSEGDFNYDGSVNAADVALLSKNYSRPLPPATTPPTPVPRTPVIPPPAASLTQTPIAPLPDSTSDSKKSKTSKIVELTKPTKAETKAVKKSARHTAK
jgi:hypothetical protein